MLSGGDRVGGGDVCTQCQVAIVMVGAACGRVAVAAAAAAAMTVAVTVWGVRCGVCAAYRLRVVDVHPNLVSPGHELILHHQHLKSNPKPRTGFKGRIPTAVAGPN